MSPGRSSWPSLGGNLAAAAEDVGAGALGPAEEHSGTTFSSARFTTSVAEQPCLWEVVLASSGLSSAQRRLILEQLGRDRLQAIAGHFGLEVRDRRSKDDHIEAVLRAERLEWRYLLGLLKRDELQAICDALGLDRSGREKDQLAARILGIKSEPAAEAPHNGKARKNGAAEQPSTEPPADKLTVDQLERYLWSAADILRGSIDSSDYKNFIFGLLFLKRLSDVFEEEAEKLIAQGEPADLAWSDPDYHPFFVPKRARWSELQKVATNIGEALNKATSALEEANSSLDGILAGIDFNDSAGSATPRTGTPSSRSWSCTSPSSTSGTRPSPSRTCSGARTSTSSSSSPTTPERKAASSTRPGRSSSSSSSCCSRRKGCASATRPRARAACWWSAPSTSSDTAAARRT